MRLPPLLKLCPWLLLALLCASRAASAQSTFQVTINSTPPGAAVYVDGKHQGMRGVTAPTFRLRLSRGPHQLLLELPGYKPLERTIQVSRSDSFLFPLERAPGRLEVRVPASSDSARDAEVFIDGVLAGRVPLDKEVPEGRHLLEVRKPGFLVFSETVEVRAAEGRAVWVVLEPEARLGSLLVSTDVPQATVLVDGVVRGPAPVVVDRLPEGEHLVEVRRPEEGAPTWQKQVRVIAGQRVQVLARPEAPRPKGGSLLVVGPEGAEVLVDGTRSAKVNQIIEDLAPGQHVLDVRAPDREPVSQTVTVEVGRQQVVNVDLPKTAKARGVGTLRIILGTPVSGAQFFVNGRPYDESRALSDKGIELPAGRNVVVVRREGYAQVRKDVELRAGSTETVTIDLRSDGLLRVHSTPAGAQVLLDGAPVGQTPWEGADVPAGQHRVELRLPGYEIYLAQVQVRAGEQAMVTAQLVLPQAPPQQADPMAYFSQTSLSALTLAPGTFTVDVGAGYPYFVDVRLVVGAARAGWFGLDAGVALRSTIFETDVAAVARGQLLRAGPIALGVNLFVGGGGGPRRRNSFVFEAGVPLTLIAGDRVRLTARPYVQVYSDRHCPDAGDLVDLGRQGRRAEVEALASPEHGSDRCTGQGQAGDGTPLPNAIADAAGFNQTTGTFGAPTYDPGNARYQVDGIPVLDRFSAARFYIQAVLEVVITRNVNLWLLFESAPGQPERQLFTRKFNPIFPVLDTPVYGRAGLTFKF